MGSSWSARLQIFSGLASGREAIDSGGTDAPAASLSEGEPFAPSLVFLLAAQPNDDVDPVDLHAGRSLGQRAHFDMGSGDVKESIRLLDQEMEVI